MICPVPCKCRICGALATIDALRAEQARAVAEAVQVERERCIKLVCSHCEAETPVCRIKVLGEPFWRHELKRGPTKHCRASAIHEAAHAEAGKKEGA